MQNPNTRQRLADLVRYHRVRKGMTQRQLADLSTVSVRAIRDLELGRTQRPQHTTLRLIADGLGLTDRGRTNFLACGQAEESSWHQDLELVSPPVPLAPLVCRELEVAAITELLGNLGHRLVTVTGLPGVGKTRLMLEVACQLNDTGRLKVLWSSRDAAPVAGRANGLAAAIRVAVGAVPLTMVGPRTGEASTENLSSIVEDRPVLLVLDGYEVADLNVAGVTHLLESCRGLQIVITARTPVSIHGIRTVPLAPLAVPAAGTETTLAQLGSVPSVRYLVRHLRHTQPGFELTSANARQVAELCYRLDGLPAALEGIASWLAVCSLEILLECVRRDPFDVLTLIADSGQRGLGGELAHAIDGLDPADAVSLDQLARAEDGWSLSDAIRLTGQPASVCAQLVSRLLSYGLARACDEQREGGFSVLELVRTRRAGAISVDFVRAV